MLVLDMPARLTVELVLDLLGVIPQDLLAELTPQTLSGALAALALSPLVGSDLPHIVVAVQPLVETLRPDVLEVLETTDEHRQAEAQFAKAVAHLAAAAHASSSPAIVAASCRNVHQHLSALNLLVGSNASDTLTSILGSLMCLEGLPPQSAADLLAALLQHSKATVRRTAFEFLASQAAGSSVVQCYVRQPGVMAAVILIGCQAPDLLQHAAAALASLLSGDARAWAGRALSCWEPWLAFAGPALGAINASLLQLIDSTKVTVWQQLQPALMCLFSTEPHTAAAAATSLLATLVNLQLPSAGFMPCASQPFDGMLLPATTGGSGGAILPAAGSSAAALFTETDVEGLVHTVCAVGLPPELVAQALGQLAQLAKDPRFHGILLTDEGVQLAICRHNFFRLYHA